MELKGKLASLPPFSVREEATKPQDRVQFDSSTAVASSSESTSSAAGAIALPHSKEKSESESANVFILEKSSKSNDETSLGEHLIIPAIVGVVGTALCVGMARYIHGLFFAR